jgi:uncharacterized membrane protein YozB (DUF420 family)
MKINNMFIRRNITFFSIVIFLLLFVIINLLKPSFLYEKDGSIRNFGIGSRQKTITPIWLISIVLGILSYLFVLYYITIPKFR